MKKETDVRTLSDSPFENATWKDIPVLILVLLGGWLLIAIVWPYCFVRDTFERVLHVRNRRPS